MFFIGVFGIEENEKELTVIRNIVCPACGRYAAARVILQYTFFHFFFIPLFKWNKRYFIRLNCCGAVYACNEESAQEILRTGKIGFDKCSRPDAGRGSQDGACLWCGGRLMGDFVYCPYCGKRI